MTAGHQNGMTKIFCHLQLEFHFLYFKTLDSCCSKSIKSVNAFAIRSTGRIVKKVDSGPVGLVVRSAGSNAPIGVKILTGHRLRNFLAPLIRAIGGVLLGGVRTRRLLHNQQRWASGCPASRCRGGFGNYKSFLAPFRLIGEDVVVSVTAAINPAPIRVVDPGPTLRVDAGLIGPLLASFEPILRRAYDGSNESTRNLRLIGDAESLSALGSRRCL